VGEIILITGVLTTVALAASLLAGRVRVPALLLFLAIGMAIGSDGLDLVDFSDYELARDVGIVALALIIFEGGLTTNAESLRSVAGTAAVLSIGGTLLTAVITGAAAVLLFDLGTLEGMLLGGIIASTDAAAVFAVMRGSALPPRTAHMLEGEAASNDPVAILLVIGFIQWIQQPDYGALDMLWLLIKQLGLGAVVGVAVGVVAVRVLRRIDLPTIGLYPVASLAVAAIAFGIPDVLGGSGFLAVYAAGLVLGSSLIPAKRTVTAFHTGLAWLSQLSMFFTLGLLVFPSQLGDVALEGTLLALVLAFIARPVAVAITTALGPLTRAERVLVGWAGLRGAVPVVLATFPVIAGIPESVDFFNIIFFAVVFSLLLQGPTFEPLARRLGLTVDSPPLPEPIAEIGSSRRLGAEVVEYEIGAGDAAANARVRDLGLPREAVVSVIVRDGNALPPRGSMRLAPGDHLHILVRREASRELAELVERWRNGPLGPPPRPPRSVRGVAPIFTVKPLADDVVEGEITRPQKVLGEPVVARLRVRRDEPGALVLLADGRYAVLGPIVMVGSRDDLANYARRRAQRAESDEKAWLQTVVGALAADTFT
jgi:cell volume regulation protein A